ncbi:LytTR family DNA-binding domain-containing protein [bacterium]|nr:LytTR family DNA-binding domain-containing protein [bacterium]
MFYERNEIRPNRLSLKVLIVEPDIKSRQHLVSVLSKDPEVKSVKEINQGIEAISAIRDYKPDVLISDVELQDINGFALLDTVPTEKQPVTIFLSDGDQYAARAFEVSAVDYLLKPVRTDRFERAFERAKHALQRERNPKTNDLNHQRQLAIKTGRCVFFVKADELDWAEAEGKYVVLHMGPETLQLKMSITALEAELDPEKFVRIHRSTIINTDRVRWVQPWNHGRNYQVILQDGTRLILSRKETLRKLTGNSFTSSIERASTF